MTRRVCHWPALWRRGRRAAMVGMAAVSLLAASPAPRGLTLQVPANPLQPNVPSTAAPLPPSGAFAPAPLPNRDMDAPSGPRASNDPSLSPGIFTRSDTYRGEGFSKGSTPQAEQEKRVKPGAGFNLKVPFAPN